MSPRRRRYLTTPIYYATREPHLGTAYTTILADILARFYRRDGEDVFFLTGMDEHGQKVMEEASRRGMESMALCDQIADRYREAWEGLDISYDRFIRTTEAEHIAVVRALLQRLYDRGHIYLGHYQGWYCVPDERYWTEKDLGENQTCPDCGRPVQQIEEENYFFRMSAFQSQLLGHIEDHPDWIVPESRKNEVVGFLQKPLADLSITRPRSRIPWGIPMPWDEQHICYVWMDALTNYVTASGAIDPSRPPDGQGFEDTTGSRWPADLHLVGKDIVTTHAVYWPTFLLGAGLPLPRQILAHGWWVVGEDKMSKSLGNVVDPLALKDQFGSDGVRWYLLREMSTGQDAAYTPERFLVRYEELANILGNLASRALSMIVRYRDGRVPEAPGTGLDQAILETVEQVRGAMEAFRVHEALGAAMDLARQANGYVEDREPWAQAKDPARSEDLDETLATLARVLTALVALFEPVAPARMHELAERLGLTAIPTLDEAMAIDLHRRTVTHGKPLFPKADRAPEPPASGAA